MILNGYYIEKQMISDKEMFYIICTQTMIERGMSTREIQKETGLAKSTLCGFIHRKTGLKTISDEIYKLALRQLKLNKKNANNHRKTFKNRRI